MHRINVLLLLNDLTLSIQRKKETNVQNFLHNLCIRKALSNSRELLYRWLLLIHSIKGVTVSIAFTSGLSCELFFCYIEALCKMFRMFVAENKLQCHVSLVYEFSDSKLSA